MAAANTLDTATTDALAAARTLVSLGVPVLRARPAMNGNGWDAKGGHNGTGYWLPKGWQQAAPDEAEVDSWQPGDALLAVMGHGLDLIDVDPRNGGDLAALPCPLPTVYGEAASPSEGRHYFVRSLGVRSRDNVADGIDVKAGDNGSGHGFAFIAPTVRRSKVTGEEVPYAWTLPPTAPSQDDASGEPLREHLRSMNGHRRHEEVLQPAADAFTDLETATRERVKRWTEATVEGIRGDLDAAQRWSHEERDERGRGWERLCADAAWKLARLALTGWCPLAPEEAQRVYLAAAPTDADWTERDVRDKWNAQARAAKRAGPWPWRADFDRLDVDVEAILADEAREETGAEQKQGTALPLSFWTATPTLAHIRQAAQSSQVAPSALLGAVLARVSFATDYRITLPNNPAHGALALFVGLVGGSGASKTSAAYQGERLLPVAETVCDCGAGPTDDHPGNFQTVPQGSGEGLARAFYNPVTERTGSGKPRTVLRRDTHNLLVAVDEVQTLLAIGDRSAATVDTVLRSMWSETRAGFQNASNERKYPLQPGTYRLALIVGCQPEVTAGLFDTSKSKGGTPQRLVWFDAEDQDVPNLDAGETEPDWPGPLSLPPGVPDPILTADDPETDPGISVAEAVSAELRLRRNRQRRGVEKLGALDQHRDFNRLRVAALLARLHHEAEVTEQWWALAGVVMDSSDRIRARLLERARKAWQQENRSRGAADAQREEGRSLAVAEVTERVARRVVRIVGRHEKKHEGVGCTRKCFSQGLESATRTRLPDALRHAEDMDWLRDEDGHWKKGESQPREES